MRENRTAILDCFSPEVRDQKLEVVGHRNEIRAGEHYPREEGDHLSGAVAVVLNRLEMPNAT